MSFAFFRDPQNGLHLFLNLGSLTNAVAQVVQLCTANLTLADNVDSNNVRRMNREGLFNTAAVRNSSYSEGLRDSAAMLCNDGAFEHLNSFAGAFLDFVVNTNGVTNFETRYSFLLLLFRKSLNKIQL